MLHWSNHAVDDDIAPMLPIVNGSNPLSSSSISSFNFNSSISSLKTAIFSYNAVAEAMKATLSSTSTIDDLHSMMSLVAPEYEAVDTQCVSSSSCVYY
jgi:hypothetical protein